MGETLLEMVNINKEFPGVRALSNINFDLKKAKCTASAVKTAPENQL